jgi:hypothetical protein
LVTLGGFAERDLEKRSTAMTVQKMGRGDLVYLRPAVEKVWNHRLWRGDLALQKAWNHRLWRGELALQKVYHRLWRGDLAMEIPADLDVEKLWWGDHASEIRTEAVERI